MGGNGEPLAHGRIWSEPLKLLLPALYQSYEALLVIRKFGPLSATNNGDHLIINIFLNSENRLCCRYVRLQHRHMA